MRRCFSLGLGVLALGGLTACDDLPTGEGTGPRSMALAGGDLSLSAPFGYCIDMDHSADQGGAGGFALIASCRSLTGVGASPAVMTVSVGPNVDATDIRIDELEAALGSPQVLGRGQSNGMAILHLANGGARILPGGDPRYWRGVTAVSGRLVSVALYAPSGSDEAGPAGRATLKRLGAGLRSKPTAPNPFSGALPGKPIRGASGSTPDIRPVARPVSAGSGAVTPATEPTPTDKPTEKNLFLRVRGLFG